MQALDHRVQFDVPLTGAATAVSGSAINLRDAVGANVASYNNEFLITWIDSYVLSVNGVESIWMTNQKQQAFKTAPGITHFTS